LCFIIYTMIKWFKRHFVPHAENDHRPHFLRSENARAIITVVLFFELIVFILPTFHFVGIVKNSNLGSVLPVVLATLTNEERIQNSLPELVVSPALTQAATLKAEDMATKGYFAHVSPEGKTPWHWFQKVGYKYDYAGENLAVNFTDSKDVTDAWMNSPGHKANIIKANYKEMGTGIAFGTYKGQDTIFVVQMYANPHIEKQGVFAQLVPEAEAAEVLNNEKTEVEIVSDLVKESMPVGEGQVALAPRVLAEQPIVPYPTSTAGRIAPTAPQDVPSLFERILASPRHMVNAILLVVAGIVILAMLLIFIIKFNHRHPDLVTNGLVILAFVFGIYLVNAYISRQTNLSTSYTSFEYQQE